MYSYDIMHGEDWGDGPVASSDYDYPTPLAALDAALDVIYAADYMSPDDGRTGVYVQGMQDERGEGPQWEWSPYVHANGGPILSAMENADDIYSWEG